MLSEKSGAGMVKPHPSGTPSRPNQARDLCHRSWKRVLLEWGQGKVVLKFTTSEEMLPLSSSSQTRVSSCEVYTRMMHFIMVAVDGGRTERLFAVLARRCGTSNRDTGQDGDLPAAGGFQAVPVSLLHRHSQIPCFLKGHSTDFTNVAVY